MMTLQTAKETEDMPIRVEVYRNMEDPSGVHQIAINYAGRECMRRRYDSTQIENARQIIADIAEEVSAGYRNATRVAIHPEVITASFRWGAKEAIPVSQEFFERLKEGLAEEIKLPVELRD